MEFSIKLSEAAHGCRPVEQIHAAAVLSRLGLGWGAVRGSHPTDPGTDI
jgi:hypothetical protein